MILITASAMQIAASMPRAQRRIISYMNLQMVQVTFSRNSPKEFEIPQFLLWYVFIRVSTVVRDLQKELGGSRYMQMDEF